MSGDDHHRTAIIGRLFAVLTSRLEDATQLAVEGQSPGNNSRGDLAQQLIEIGQETAAIAEAIVLIIEQAGD